MSSLLQQNLPHIFWELATKLALLNRPLTSTDREVYKQKLFRKKKKMKNKTLKRNQSQKKRKLLDASKMKILWILQSIYT